MDFFPTSGFLIQIFILFYSISHPPQTLEDLGKRQRCAYWQNGYCYQIINIAPTHPGKARGETAGSAPLICDPEQVPGGSRGQDTSVTPR